MCAHAGHDLPGTFRLFGDGHRRRRRRAELLFAHTAAGRLWRFDLETAEPTLIDTGDADLTFSDGLVVQDDLLVAVRNQAHVLTYLRLSEDATSAEPVTEVPTDPARVLTTGDVVDGHLLLVDSQFDEHPPSRNSEVVVLPFDG